jgi:inner membrane transporter RhtA
VRTKIAPPPPQAYFVGSAVFHYLGPAFAVLLFARVAPLGVAWLRIVSAAVVFALWRRPWRTLGRAGYGTVRVVVALGIVLAVMNSCFYEAIARLPLGTVSAIEFLPVIVLAAMGVRSPRNGLALMLAVAGVFALVAVQLRGEPLGVALAFGNAALFALYIVLAHRVSRAPGVSGIDGLAGAMLIAAPVSTAIGGWAVIPHVLDPVAIGAGIGVGITSSVIPYVCDQLAMTRLSRATYSLMVSLLPATATVIGIVVLAQIPSARQVFGVALVVGAVALHRDRAEVVAARADRECTAADVARDIAAGSGSEAKRQTTRGEMMARRDESSRYREAAHSALDQIDRCVEYLRLIRKPTISRQLARNTSAIRRRIDERGSGGVPRERARVAPPPLR